jgi:hypothetical protein
MSRAKRKTVTRKADRRLTVAREGLGRAIYELMLLERTDDGLAWSVSELRQRCNEIEPEQVRAVNTVYNWLASGNAGINNLEVLAKVFGVPFDELRKSQTTRDISHISRLRAIAGVLGDRCPWNHLVDATRPDEYPDIEADSQDLDDEIEPPEDGEDEGG